MLGCIQPMSSPMMNRMFGLPAALCATATAGASASATTPAHIYLRKRIRRFLTFNRMCARARPPDEHVLVRMDAMDVQAKNQHASFDAEQWTMCRGLSIARRLRQRGGTAYARQDSQRARSGRPTNGWGDEHDLQHGGDVDDLAHQSARGLADPEGHRKAGEIGLDAPRVPVTLDIF